MLEHFRREAEPPADQSESQTHSITPAIPVHQLDPNQSGFANKLTKLLERVPTGGAVIIGRDPSCELFHNTTGVRVAFLIKIADPKGVLSRDHCAVRKELDGFWVSNLGVNGTIILGRVQTPVPGQLAKEFRLLSGQQIKIPKGIDGGQIDYGITITMP